MPLGKVAVGDKVLAAAASGAAVESRVIFVHDHVEASPTLRISYGVCVCVCVCVCVLDAGVRACASRTPLHVLHGCLRVLCTCVAVVMYH